MVLILVVEAFLEDLDLEYIPDLERGVHVAILEDGLVLHGNLLAYELNVRVDLVDVHRI